MSSPVLVKPLAALVEQVLHSGVLTLAQEVEIDDWINRHPIGDSDLAVLDQLIEALTERRVISGSSPPSTALPIHKREEPGIHPVSLRTKLGPTKKKPSTTPKPSDPPDPG